MSCARSAKRSALSRNNYPHAALVRTAAVASCLLPEFPRRSLHRVILVRLHMAIGVILQAVYIVPVDGTWAMVSE